MKLLECMNKDSKIYRIQFKKLEIEIPTGTGTDYTWVTGDFLF
jgi:hypothetical protein